jgi:hypothetical protein
VASEGWSCCLKQLIAYSKQVALGFGSHLFHPAFPSVTNRSPDRIFLISFPAELLFIARIF